MSSYTVIDGDGHVIEPLELWQERTDPKYHDRIPRPSELRGRFLLEDSVLPAEERMPDKLRERIGEMTREKYPEALQSRFGPEARLTDMAREGIDFAVLYPTLGLLMGGMKDPGLALAVCRAYNDWLLDYCHQCDGKATGVAMIYLHDVPAAIEEVKRVHKLGLKAAFIRPGPHQPRDLGHPTFHPFYAECQRLDMPVVIHEATSSLLPSAGADRFNSYLFKHVVTHPFEQMLQCLSFVCGGALESFPNLRVAFMESGAGWLPYWLWRMDEHYEMMGDLLTPWLKMKPSEYFERQCYISCDPDEWVLPRIIDLIGEDKIIFASDYPHFDSRFPESVASVREVASLSDRTKRKILGENAARFYKL
ncbi:MAG: amidohydrolase [Chloroflexi bacterium]|nr:amidohydrolase [Chloroflexota bacterium]